MFYPSNLHCIVYDDNLSTASGAIPSPRTSPFPTGDYVHASSAGQLPDYAAAAAAGYVHFPPSCEAWTATIPAPVQQQQQQHSNVSSPSPSSVGADDFATSGQYLPTSAPMMPSSSMANALRTGEEIKMEYEDGNGKSPPLPFYSLLSKEEFQETELSETDLIVSRPWIPSR